MDCEQDLEIFLRNSLHTQSQMLGKEACDFTCMIQTQSAVCLRNAAPINTRDTEVHKFDNLFGYTLGQIHYTQQTPPPHGSWPTSPLAAIFRCSIGTSRKREGERWREWVKKRCRRKVREFRHLRRNEGLWYMVQQDSSCAVRRCVCVCVFAFNSAKHHKSWRTFHIQGVHKVR